MSLLAFFIPIGAACEGWSQLASVLSWRVPRSEAVGLLGADHLGVVLPDTSIADAHAIAREVLDAVAEQHECEFDYAVLVYPSHEFAAQADDDGADKPEEPLNAHPMEALFALPMPSWKRLIDIVGSAIGLVLLSPLLLVVSLAIKLSSPGPIFFVQDREGIGGRRFKIFKLRTMHVDAEQQKSDLHELNERDGPAFKIRNDPRATRLGRVLRKTCIDELPQLWNVVKGDMSLVGPRPLPWEESRACARWHRRRLDVAPGLTCTWQLHGEIGMPFDVWMRMDIDYVENYCLWTDVKLVLQTMWRILLMRASH
ncbi:MAG TPA: sugar transferase [Pirellulales bacterium]|nr:sugar transferase [Pirellulales bacterium]